MKILQNLIQVKPSNFLYDRERRRYRMIDFGLAQFVALESAAASTSVVFFALNFFFPLELSFVQGTETSFLFFTSIQTLSFLFLGIISITLNF